MITTEKFSTSQSAVLSIDLEIIFKKNFEEKIHDLTFTTPKHKLKKKAKSMKKCSGT